VREGVTDDQRLVVDDEASAMSARTDEAAARRGTSRDATRAAKRNEAPRAVLCFQKAGDPVGERRARRTECAPARDLMDTGHRVPSSSNAELPKISRDVAFLQLDERRDFLTRMIVVKRVTECRYLRRLRGFSGKFAVFGVVVQVDELRPDEMSERCVTSPIRFPALGDLQARLHRSRQIPAAPSLKSRAAAASVFDFPRRSPHRGAAAVDELLGAALEPISSRGGDGRAEPPPAQVAAAGHAEMPATEGVRE